MRRIKKGLEPGACIAHRNAGAGAIFGNAPKDKMREALYAEQEGLCAYCMCALKEATDAVMKVEHHVPQSVDDSLELVWSNLLGVCKGGEGLPRKQQTCDTRRGNRPIPFDPTDPAIERQICYETRGRVFAADPSEQPALDDVLGLNTDAPLRARESVLEAFLDCMKRSKPTGTWTAADYEAELARFRMTRNQRTRGFIGIVEWFVARRRRGSNAG